MKNPLLFILSAAAMAGGDMVRFMRSFKPTGTRPRAHGKTGVCAARRKAKKRRKILAKLPK